MTAAPILLLADIGGTNTRVALSDGPRVRHDSIRKYPNAKHPDLGSVLRQFFADEGSERCDGACVAAAGPVRDGIAEMTNLSWVIRPGDLAAATGARTVAILNDLQAQGHALGHLASSALRRILPGLPQPEGASQLVIGVGTGFNAAPVHETPGGRVVAPSECGHSGLSVRTEEDLRLSRFVEQAHGYPGVEDVLSGRGLERVHAWVTTEAGRPASMTAAEIMAALDARDPDAVRSGAVFVRTLGAVVGNLALIHLPFGGVYLIGGVARAFTPWFDEFGFASAFRDKGRFSEFMDEFPVALIEDDYAALQGCAAHLTTMMPV